MIGAMSRRWLALLLLPCGLRAEDRAREVTLPPVSRVSNASAPPALTVILTKEGGLFLRDGSVPIGLDVLGKALAASAVPKEKRGGVEVSTATVLIRADREAPWQHVQWVLRSCAENRISKVQFAACTAEGVQGVVETPLPLDAGLPADAARPTRLLFRVVAREERPERIGQHDVLKPTKCVYCFGDQQSSDATDLARWAREGLAAAKKAGQVVESEIDAGHKVPFGSVLLALDTLRGAGVEAVFFKGTKEPDAGLRRAVPLPYPLKNYDDQ